MHLHLDNRCNHSEKSACAQMKTASSDKKKAFLPSAESDGSGPAEQRKAAGSCFEARQSK